MSTMEESASSNVELSLPETRRLSWPFAKELREIWKYRYVTYSYVYTQVKFRYRRSYLGFIWTVLGPMIHYIMIGLMMSLLLKTRPENYFTFYFSGAIFYSLISGVIAKAPFIMLSNEHYIKKIYVPKAIFLTNVVCYELTNFALSSVALLAMGLISGSLHMSVAFPMAMLALILTSVFLLGIAAVLSIMTVYFRDFTHITPVLLQALFFVTPIAFNITMLPEKYQWIVWVNPLYYFLHIFREPLLNGQIPSFKYYIATSAMALVSSLIGMWFLRKFENKIVFKL